MIFRPDRGWATPAVIRLKLLDFVHHFRPHGCVWVPIFSDLMRESHFWAVIAY